MTFLKETISCIEDSEHEVTDIIFIGSESSGHRCTWQEFETLADFPYDSGYGSSAVATDLIIVFSDGSRMNRGEYDGSEWWDYDSPFNAPKENHKITCLGGDSHMWDRLDDMNE